MRAFPFSKLAVVALSLLLSTTASAQPAYDLTGAWLLIGNDVQQSFCDGSSSQELIAVLALVEQDGESVTMTIADENVLTGRTSGFFVAVEELGADASTVLTGAVSADANWITGTLVFFDKHPCPDAETGQTRFVLIRIG